MRRQTTLIAIGIAIFSLVMVMVMAVYSRTTTDKAEYCAEEMVNRKVIDGQLIEYRKCVSWVGWPIQVIEVAK